MKKVQNFSSVSLKHDYLAKKNTGTWGVNTTGSIIIGIKVQMNSVCYLLQPHYICMGRRNDAG